MKLLSCFESPLRNFLFHETLREPSRLLNKITKNIPASMQYVGTISIRAVLK